MKLLIIYRYHIDLVKDKSRSYKKYFSIKIHYSVELTKQNCRMMFFLPSLSGQFKRRVKFYAEIFPTRTYEIWTMDLKLMLGLVKYLFSGF